MTTFKQFLTEQQEHKQIVGQITKHCQPYISSGGGVTFNLHRGMEDQGSFVHKKVRKDREPMSTPLVVQHFIDQWFNKNYGFPYRSGGLFATGNDAEADFYAGVSEEGGNVYKIYPIGQFSFIWSPNIDDMHNKLVELDEFIDENHGEQYTLGIFSGQIPKTLSSLHQKLIKQTLENATFNTNDLAQAAYSGHEVMIACDSYYALDDSIDEKTMAQALKE